MTVLTVRTGQLRAGSSTVTELGERCVTYASEVVGALIGLAGCAGHPAMESALLRAARQGTATYFAVAELGSSTGQTTSSVRAGWSGSGAAAILLVSGELADGVAGTAAALEQIVTAIRGYVPFLTDAQRKVNAYNLCVADASIAEDDGNYVSAIGDFTEPPGWPGKPARPLACRRPR